MTVKPLTDRQQSFVCEWLKDQDATAACRRAGYTGKHVATTARDLVKQPHIKAAMRRALAEQQKRTLQSADLVLLNIQRVAEKAERAREFRTAIYGWEKIGQHYKLFTEKHEHGGLGGGPIQFQITEKEADA